TFVLAGGAGCTVRNSIGSSDFGTMALYENPPIKSGRTIRYGYRNSLFPPVLASKTFMIGCLNFFQSSSLAETHMNTATRDTVPYIARTLNGIGGYTRNFKSMRTNGQQTISCQTLGHATPMADIM